MLGDFHGTGEGPPYLQRLFGPVLAQRDGALPLENAVCTGTQRQRAMVGMIDNDQPHGRQLPDHRLPGPGIQVLALPEDLLMLVAEPRDLLGFLAQ
jgi:hypothetical protein